MTVKALGYVVIQATDMNKWDDFLTNVVGVMSAGEDETGARLYRVDARPFRLRIERGPEDRFLTAGYELTSGSFDETLEIIRNSGQVVTLASDEEARLRGVDALATTSDPAGNGLEFYHGDSVSDEPFLSPLGIKKFVTGDMGMGHAVFAAPDFRKSHDFYKAIGFADTDIPAISPTGPDGPIMRFAFMHASNGRHHSIAIGEMPVPPSRCIHIMLEVESLDEVGRAYDRVLAAGCPVSATIGKHMNDEMVSFYVQTPGGFDLEFGYDGMQINPEDWQPTAHEEVSQWGHVWAWQEEMKKQAASASEQETV